MPTSTRIRASEARVRIPCPASTRFACSPRTARGFTLLELTITLVILAIAVSFLIPRLRDAESAALESSAARLAVTTRYVYEEAAFRRRPMRLNLDLDKHAYWVSVLNDDTDDPEFVMDDSAISRPVVLPGGVAFADVILPALGLVHEGLVFAEFFPEGYADPLVVHLTNARHEFATLAIEPLTGRTRVAHAYVALNAARIADAARDRPDDTGQTQGRSFLDGRSAGGGGNRAAAP